MAVSFSRYQPVTIVRAAGTQDEKRWEARASGTLDYNALFHADVDIKRGDQIHADVFDEPRVVASVHPKFASSGLTHREVDLEPLSAVQEGSGIPATVQVVHGNVGQLAGRDINVNISATVLLRALDDAVERSELPEAERTSIRQKLRELVENPYVTSIGSSLIAEAFKKVAGI